MKKQDFKWSLKTEKGLEEWNTEVVTPRELIRRSKIQEEVNLSGVCLGGARWKISEDFQDRIRLWSLPLKPLLLYSLNVMLPWSPTSNPFSLCIISLGTSQSLPRLQIGRIYVENCQVFISSRDISLFLYLKLVYLFIRFLYLTIFQLQRDYWYSNLI